MGLAREAPQVDTLDRLRGDETSLEAALQAARTEAHQIELETTDAIARLENQACTEREELQVTQRAQAQLELLAALNQAREETTLRLGQVREAARRNRDAALAAALVAVLPGADP